MVHCIDIAGGSMEQASAGSDRMCRRALTCALFEDNPLPDPLPASHSGRKTCCRFFAMAAPPAHAIYFELLTLGDLDATNNLQGSRRKFGPTNKLQREDADDFP
jgi:hypothetical protein